MVKPDESKQVVFQQATVQTDRQIERCKIIPNKSIDCYLCPEYYQGCPIMRKAAGEPERKT